MNPLWWEEATAIWAQYEVYPSHTGYYTKDIHPSWGEEWLRNGYANWNYMEPEEMNGAMALAVYLQSKKATAVLETFWTMSDDWTGPAGAIETVTGKPFADFYKEFAQAYWSKSFEPVKSWNWASRTDPLVMTQPVNTVFQRTLPALSSGFLKIQATTTSPPASFSSGIGSTARIASTCTGKNFYFYDSTRKIISGLQFEGVSPPPDYDALYHNHLLGDYTAGAPLYLLYIDNRYGYTADCIPAVTLEEPTVDGVYPSSVPKNTTRSFTVSGRGFGPDTTPGTVLMIGGATPTVTSWSPNGVTFSWTSGATPNSVTVYILNKKGARSNGMPITITN